MLHRLILLAALAGALAFPDAASAINRNGRVISGGIIGGAKTGGQFGAARNRGALGRAPFYRPGSPGGRLPGGPHVGGADAQPKK